MLRVNMLLMLFSVFCALATVTSQHKARRLFQALEVEQERARQLDIEFGQLQLELSTWAAHPRIEQIAREHLKMRAPDSAHIVVARSGPYRAGAVSPSGAAGNSP